MLGAENPSTLTSMNKLALVLSRQGKYKQAEQMYRQALRLRETVLGKEHTSTLASVNNLASVLSDHVSPNCNNARTRNMHDISRLLYVYTVGLLIGLDDIKGAKFLARYFKVIPSHDFLI